MIEFFFIVLLPSLVIYLFLKLGVWVCASLREGSFFRDRYD